MFNTDFENWFFDRQIEKWILPVREDVQNNGKEIDFLTRKINTKHALRIKKRTLSSEKVFRECYIGSNLFKS